MNKGKNPGVEYRNLEQAPRTRGEEVSDPHPGSVSDGTHPEASETKLPRGADDRHTERRPT
ncbi:hypothetical protein [Shinella zoogloeoides]|uniref:hypothetical protein n=1 Tax=Shinella zoogloeoides TaxID=352475 RepID=UPI00273EFD33|nr:hypothetical protein [Shinella zoogloeoides]WLR95404.1 hypothetical protein Q9316_24780 [Shinella zoogloeoides]